MGSLDIPEVLILLGIVGILAWAAYNRLHPGAGESK
jgi:hypothetical protein